MPSANPFRVIPNADHGGGTTANSASESSAAQIRTRIAPARRPGRISETTLIPRNFETA